MDHVENAQSKPASMTEPRVRSVTVCVKDTRKIVLYLGPKRCDEQSRTEVLLLGRVKKMLYKNEKR